MNKILLKDVFGISTDVPKYTYVDRQLLDKKFEHYLQSQKHIVLHGASKQGKSCLRRKNIDEQNCIVIHCAPKMMRLEDVWSTALQQMGESSVSHTTTTEASGSESGVSAGAKAAFMGLGGSTGVETSSKNESLKTEERESIDRDLLQKLIDALSKTQKRLVLEDFHYLPDNVRRDVAFGLKALYETRVYVVVVGIWSEQNLLTYYNGDLTGRVEEINLTWTEDELNEVLSKGEGALNIEFAAGLKQQLVNSAFENVGLLQRLAEKICIETNIYESQNDKTLLSDIELLNTSRKKIVQDIRQRYIKIAEVFREGLRAGSELLLYARIYNELIDANDNELINGIARPELLRRMQKHNMGQKEIRQADLTQILDRIERLQAERGITPLLVSYSRDLQKLFLNDREFLFYRAFSGDDKSHLKLDLES
ncbi:hypothetical protein IIA94_03195 [Patescibacteria group bacterium]|nr:hypothetical protein [Patescibacteria group bacterium]